jgi:hypothetical protein
VLLPLNDDAQLVSQHRSADLSDQLFLRVRLAVEPVKVETGQTVRVPGGVHSLVQCRARERFRRNELGQ